MIAGGHHDRTYVRNHSNSHCIQNIETVAKGVRYGRCLDHICAHHLHLGGNLRSSPVQSSRIRSGVLGYHGVWCNECFEKLKTAAQNTEITW